MSQAKLVHPNGELLLGEVPATVGSPGYDVSSLLKETGYITLDPGFMNTASCQSAITYIDGDKGILRYRGYPIEQLAAKSTFIETSYLLIYVLLPLLHLSHHHHLHLSHQRNHLPMVNHLYLSH